MIQGEVTSRREAVLNLRLRAGDGSEIDIDFILDTGFSDFLTLPRRLIDVLQFPRWDATAIRLAGGSYHVVPTYEGKIYWNDHWREIIIQESDGDPLIGMALLYDHLVTLDVVTGGSVLVEDRN